MSRTLTVALIAPVLLALACGSGGGAGGDGDGGAEGKAKSLDLAFEPDAPNPGPGTAALGLEIGAGDTIGLRVGVSGVDDVFAVSMDVTFNPDRVDFVDWSVGDLLETSGTKPFYLVSEQPGRLVIGISLSGTGSGVDVSASLSLLRLTFRALEEGGSHIDFENMALLDSSAIPQEIPGITWFGGDFLAN